MRIPNMLQSRWELVSSIVLRIKWEHEKLKAKADLSYRGESGYAYKFCFEGGALPAGEHGGVAFTAKDAATAIEVASDMFASDVRRRIASEDVMRHTIDAVKAERADVELTFRAEADRKAGGVAQ